MLTLQSPLAANAVLDALVGSIDPDLERLSIAVAYVTLEGAKTLIDGVRTVVDQRRWNVTEKQIVTCFDFGHTEPNALQHLAADGFEVRIANLGAGRAIHLRPATPSFHPKLYISGSRHRTVALVGSANLSRRALTLNWEAVTSLVLAPADVAQIWDPLYVASEPLDDALLDAYRALRPTAREWAPPDEVPIPVVPDARRLDVFRDVVEAGLRVESSEAFWVEVGYSSGGSGNQLELPRRANRFFGYHFNNYDDDHHTIGEPTITAGAASWSRPLTWHGNNRMERINLPTMSQGGFAYRQRVVLFQRHGSTFELTVADVGSARANRWRDESAAAGTLFRVSNGSTRLCGLL